MKLGKSIIYVLLLLLTTSAVLKDSSPAIGMSEGSRVPDLQLLTSDAQNFRLSDYRGKKVILQFWSSVDASSRIQNVQLNNVMEQMQNSTIKMVSVSMDQSSEVAREIARMDGLHSATIFTVADPLKEKITKQFKLSNHLYGNLLINEDGVIIARNLTPKELKRIAL